MTANPKGSENMTKAGMIDFRGVNKWFGALGAPWRLLDSLYILQAYPE